jgi:hypothetical protein
MAELKQNQKNTNGGARPGAGRPAGSTNKLKVIDFFTIEEREAIVEKVKAMVLMADVPDKDIAKFLWEQLFGKATQRTELTGAEGQALQILFDKSFKGE